MLMVDRQIDMDFWLVLRVDRTRTEQEVPVFEFTLGAKNSEWETNIEDHMRCSDVTSHEYQTFYHITPTHLFRLCWIF